MNLSQCSKIYKNVLHVFYTITLLVKSFTNNCDFQCANIWMANFALILVIFPSIPLVIDGRKRGKQGGGKTPSNWVSVASKWLLFFQIKL